MVIGPQICNARVMHRRLLPKENSFSYRVYYLVLPLPAAPLPGRYVGFHAGDVGKRDGSDPSAWVRSILADYGLNESVTGITLVTMPRVLGYVFNPVSFYLCRDDDKALRAVLCEVHNTFGEQHSYLCANPDHRPVAAHQWLEAQKVFHVSPFLERNGDYRFRFDLKPDKLGIWIDYYDTRQRRQLVTSLIGRFTPLTPESLRRAFWRHPLVTLKAMTLIHWQAARLVMKGIRAIVRPRQIPHKITATRNLDKKQDKGKSYDRKRTL